MNILKFNTFNSVNEQDDNGFYVGQKVSLKEELIGGYSAYFTRRVIKDNDGTIVRINFNMEYPLIIDWGDDSVANYRVSEIIPKGMKIKRKQNLKDDPWDEENWGHEFVKENHKKFFNI